MLQDKTNRNLLGVLVLLALFYTMSYWLKQGTSGSTVLTQDLVQVDTSLITDVSIEKPGSQIELSRKDGVWMLTTEKGHEVPAVKSKVENMLAAMNRIIPSSIVSRDPDKWRDYQVDSTGQRVRVFQGVDETADIIIGRGSMQGQRTFITYIRPADEDNVYVVENFSGSSLSANSANYRDKSVLSTTVDSIRQIIFNYPGNKDFTLMKTDDQWLINGTKADSARTEKFINGLRRVTSSSFVDQQQPAPGTTPVSSLTIQSNGIEDVLIGLYEGSGSQQLLHSSQNPQNYFADTAVVNTLFVKKEDLEGM